MIKLPFTQINSIILGSPVSSPILFSFEEYVKSQVHNGVLARESGRSLVPYSRTLKYLEGTAKYSSSVGKCLKYFYEDLLIFAKSNVVEQRGIYFEIDIEDPSSKLPTTIISLDEVLGDLKLYISGDPQPSQYVGALSIFSLSEVENLNYDINLAILSVIYQAKLIPDVYKVKWKGGA